MTYVIEVPLKDGGHLLAQVNEADLPPGIEQAARPGEIALKVKDSVESALSQVLPAIKSVGNKIQELAADEMTIEFGLTLGAEVGAIVTKGTAEAHFNVTLTWRR